MITILEYIWIGGNNKLRSKTKVHNHNILSLADIPKCNYDGSSTDQAKTLDTEIILVPVKYCIDPFRHNSNSYLVLCETYDSLDVPIFNNYRNAANKIFNHSLNDKSCNLSTCNLTCNSICCNKMSNDKSYCSFGNCDLSNSDLTSNQLSNELSRCNLSSCNLDNEPWFGLEQEYFMECKLWTTKLDQGPYYCGIGNKEPMERLIADEHLELCLRAGLTISGVNAEVAPYQWEYQVGPCIGIDSGDQLYLSRYILERVAEKYEVNINYKPKLLKELNGSGCHTNFSTKSMRESGGIKYIYDAILKLEKLHTEHILVYGDDNEERLTGHHETASIDKFTYGVGTRNTSIRIPNQTVKDGCGYFEDRRPAANMDPYLVTSKIYQTCCL